MRDIDRSHRIVGEDLDRGAGQRSLDCAAGEQGGQRTFETPQIDRLVVHPTGTPSRHCSIAAR
jgi:hypothetical protein